MKILIIGATGTGKSSLLQAINDTYNGTKKYTISTHCGTVDDRKAQNADVVIWCDTVKDCQYEDTNSQFQRPQFSNENIHCYVTNMNTQFWANHIINTIL